MHNTPVAYEEDFKPRCNATWFVSLVFLLIGVPMFLVGLSLIEGDPTVGIVYGSTFSLVYLRPKQVSFENIPNFHAYLCPQNPEPTQFTTVTFPTGSQVPLPDDNAFRIYLNKGSRITLDFAERDFEFDIIQGTANYINSQGLIKPEPLFHCSRHEVCSIDLEVDREDYYYFVFTLPSSNFVIFNDFSIDMAYHNLDDCSMVCLDEPLCVVETSTHLECIVFKSFKTLTDINDNEEVLSIRLNGGQGLSLWFWVGLVFLVLTIVLVVYTIRDYRFQQKIYKEMKMRRVVK
ncbi:hypothetical protein P9112_013757 [Eukaryota sp. TZLM1-RC]